MILCLLGKIYNTILLVKWYHNVSQFIIFSFSKSMDSETTSFFTNKDDEYLLEDFQEQKHAKNDLQNYLPTHKN